MGLLAKAATLTETRGAQVTSDPHRLRAGLERALSPLQLLDMWGSGGMGEIYLARDAALRRTLAVKVLRSELVDDPEARARFSREARVIAALSHPNIIAIYSVGELEDATPYFVMDYVSGGSLADRLQSEGAVSILECRKLVAEVASALDVAHAHGVVHRDIKPSNVLVDAATGRAIVTDWGIAALDPTVHLEPDARVTSAGTILGSPRYMSPEQLAGDDVGPEADVYALGLLAFELLTGRGPFEAQSPRALMVAQLREDPPRLADVRAEVDPELDAIVARCLSKTASERPKAQDLSFLSHGSGSAVEWPPPGLERLSRALYRAAAWAGGTLASVTVPFLLVTSYPTVLRAEGVGVLVILLLVAAGFLFVYSARFVLQTGAALWRARRLGYRWSVIAELASDFRGDTGLLIAGTREYAVLSADDRRILRRQRVALGAGALAAAMLALPAAASLGAYTSPLDFAQEWWWAVTAGAIAVAVVFRQLAQALFPLTIDEPERVVAARKAFARSGSVSENVEPLVASWHRTSGIERGDARRSFVAPLAAVSLALVAASIVVVFASLLFASSMWSGMGAPRFNATLERAERVMPHRSLRRLDEAALTPVEAAEVIREVQRAPTPASGDPFELDPAHAPRLLVANDTTNTSWRLDFDRLIALAAQGLSEQERAMLQVVAADPRRPSFLRLANVEGIDWNATADHSRDPLFRELPRWAGTRDVVYRSEAQAALLVSEGRWGEAERLLRDVVSAGIVLMDESENLLGVLIGSVVAGIGLDRLADTYEVRGRVDEAATLRAAPASSRDETSSAAVPVDVLSRGPRTSWEQTRRDFYEAIIDPSLPRGMRYELATLLVGAALCADPAYVLFGPPPELESLIEELRGHVVRYPSDEAKWELDVTGVDRLHTFLPDSVGAFDSPRGLVPRLFMRGLHGVAVALGNPRLDACTAVAWMWS